MREWEICLTHNATPCSADLQDYLQAQVGNPEGANKPNKKVYDPRVWVREAEKVMVARVQQACKDLGNVDRL